MIEMLIFLKTNQCKNELLLTIS